RVVRLERNYRSTSTILDAANTVIAENVRRKGKTLYTEAGAGERITRVEAADERDEAQWICAEIEARLGQGPGRTVRDFVVLYRTNAQSRALEEELLRRDLPYQVIGGTKFYERREIMDVLAYLRLISNPLDAGAFDRIVNYPRRGIGDVSKGHLLEWAAERSVGVLQATLEARDLSALTPGAARSLEAFGGLIERFRGLARHEGVGTLLETLLREVDILEELRKEGPEGEDRVGNVQELLASAHEFDLREEDDLDEGASDATPLDRYLQRISLVTDLDRHDPQAQAVTLMTLHNAKGLEYPVVFIGGLEDGLFPLAGAFDDPDALEEERRLFYVGITRAEEKLHLLHARTRRRAGEVLSRPPSSFLAPIPAELLEEVSTPAVEAARADYGGWGGGWRRRRTERAAVEEPEGLVIDYSESQDLPRFVKGERVRHPNFGRGVIRELSGFGPDLKVTVDFESVGPKKVLVRYANLQKEL
ncbi:MAG TPA: 3'-5' exonuclease, partial [Longimicrobiales bacterium]|nr:3'-5' exonuclease [Longimicrobiales bacterium]